MPDAHVIYVDPDDFTIEQLQDITQGIDSWHAADNRIDMQAMLAPCAEGADDSACLTLSCNIGIYSGLTSYDWNRWPWDDGSRIQICPNRIFTRDQMISAAAHEAGHAMGLVHIPQPNGIMFHTYAGFTSPQPIDLQQWWSLAPRRE